MYATCLLEPVVRPDEGMSTSALIDKLFEDVLQATDREEEDEKEDERGNDSSISEGIQEADMETAETEPKLKSPSPGFGGDSCDGEQEECENLNEEEVGASERDENTGGNEDDFLSLPPSCILSPLSKSVEAVVTPMVRTFHSLGIKK